VGGGHSLLETLADLVQSGRVLSHDFWWAPLEEIVPHQQQQGEIIELSHKWDIVRQEVDRGQHVKDSENYHALEVGRYAAISKYTPEETSGMWKTAPEMQEGQGQGGPRR
jgi:hypothetical protein